MSMIKFEDEYEMKASQKILFPYLNTPGGLSQWFADDVKVDEDKIYHFYWNDEQQKARIAANRRDQFVRFEYLPDAQVGSGKNGEPVEDMPYVELSLEKNDLTESVFLRVVDYTAMDDEEEVREIWDGMIANLREMVGG